MRPGVCVGFGGGWRVDGVEGCWGILDGDGGK